LVNVEMFNDSNYFNRIIEFSGVNYTDEREKKDKIKERLNNI